MDLKTDYNNYLEEIRKEPEKEDVKLILADKLDEDGFNNVAKMVRWFAKRNKWPKKDGLNNRYFLCSDRGQQHTVSHHLDETELMVWLFFQKAHYINYNNLYVEYHFYSFNELGLFDVFTNFIKTVKEFIEII